jgi:hypothetical protein
MPKRDGRMIAAGITVMLLALLVVGRLQSRSLPALDAGVSQATKTTVVRDDPPRTSGLAVAGRVPLPGRAAAVAVGQGAVWVLLEEGTLLRVDPDRYRVTGSLRLEVSTGGIPAGPLAVGAGAIWVGTQEATVTARVDPVRLRQTATLAGPVATVARGVLWSSCCPRGHQHTGFGRIDPHTLRPHRPLVINDGSGQPQPVGRFAIGADALWTQSPNDERVWRVPLTGGAARAVARMSGVAYGLAADAGVVWVLSGAVDPGSERARPGRLRRLDQRSGQITAATPLPDLAASLAVGPVLGDDAVWLAGPSLRLADGGGILLRIDPASGRVAGWFREPLGFLQDVLAAGARGAWVGTAVPELLHVVPA